MGDPERNGLEIISNYFLGRKNSQLVDIFSFVGVRLLGKSPNKFLSATKLLVFQSSTYHESITPQAYLHIRITSLGEVSASISPEFFYWHFPYCRMCGDIHTHTSELVPHPRPARVGIRALRHIFAKTYFMNINYTAAPDRGGAPEDRRHLNSALDPPGSGLFF